MSDSASVPPRAGSARGGAWVLIPLALTAVLGAGWLLLDADPIPRASEAPDLGAGARAFLERALRPEG